MAKCDLVIIGLSGGVDSATAVHLLREEGYRVAGMTLRMLPDKIESACSAGAGFRVCCSREAVMEARVCAAKLGVPHYVVDCAADFQRDIIDYFVADHLRGRTPNPCVFCNRRIKFAFMARYAEMMGAGFVATGHYASVGYCEKYSKKLICRPADQDKDQSYMLCMLPAEYIEKIILPLGGLRKADTRALAESLGLSVAGKPDSQEICFVPDEDHRRFVRENSPPGSAPFAPGDIVDLSGKVLGRHQGIINYTVGQRKGLGISSPEPLFVIRIDAAERRVVVGRDLEAGIARFRVSGLNWHAGSGPSEGAEYQVRIRYRHRGAAATLRAIGDGTAEVELAAPERGVTPGQILAIYDGEWLLGGAVIEGAF